jgi:hypothetical protein
MSYVGYVSIYHWVAAGAWPNLHNWLEHSEPLFRTGTARAEPFLAYSRKSILAAVQLGRLHCAVHTNKRDGHRYPETQETHMIISRQPLKPAVSAPLYSPRGSRPGQLWIFHSVKPGVVERYETVPSLFMVTSHVSEI